jgi:hypothetical protein
MKGKLIKVLDQYHLYNGDKPIATTIVCNPMLLPIISLKNCEAIANGYDLDELADIETEKYATLNPKSFKRGFLYGFQKALEILGDKKFSEEQVKKAINLSWEEKPMLEIKDIIQSIQQTEWDVEIETEPMNLDEIREQGKGFLNSTTTTTTKPKLDENNCLILKPIKNV